MKATLRIKTEKCVYKCGVRILKIRNDVTYALPRKTPTDVRRKPICDEKCHK